MKQHDRFRIIVIDDNSESSNEFIKILTSHAPHAERDTLNTKLPRKSSHSEEILFPEFQLDTATQGQDGLQCINEAIKASEPYALAFVNIQLPSVLNNAETTQRILALDRDIQVVVCTADSDDSWEETINELGKNHNLLILNKPLNRIAIRQLACALTQKWKLMHDVRLYTESLEQCIQEQTNSLQYLLSITRATLESSSEGILVVDLEGNITDYNDKFVVMWNTPREVMAKKSYSALINTIKGNLVDQYDFLEKSNAIYHCVDMIDMEILRLKDGRIFERYTQPHRLNSKIIGRVWSFRDITQRAHLETKLQHQATHDALTDLPNRTCLDLCLSQAIQSIPRNNHIAILFFDLDRFKLINDSLSHAAGDALLRSMARRLNTIVRPSDTLVRLGGDEFVMIVTNITHLEHVDHIASKLLNAVREPIKIKEHMLTVTASIGISIYPKDGESATELLSNADVAMYCAKENGSNQFQYYTDTLIQDNMKRLELEMGIKN